MRNNLFIAIIWGLILSSCQDVNKPDSNIEYAEKPKWSVEILGHKANEHLDSSNWDRKLFDQDIENYKKYSEIYQNYPINKSPFPVAVYDYAVSSFPFIIETEKHIFKGVTIGEYEDPESEIITARLTLLVLTNDNESEESALVESRNFPYLTAQGYFKVSNNEYDWVFCSSPDGFSTLLVNMKLFDLRFGETVIVYPQIDRTFLYDQIKDSPNNYDDFEDFKRVIMNNQRVLNQLKSENNIK